jgi:hypothetical protein
LQLNNLLHKIHGEVLAQFLNSLVAYQVLQLVKDETLITIAQINVEEVNGSTSDGIQ